MGDRNLKIAVIGAGAIGGITAAYLAAAGYDVQLVCKHTDAAARASGEGLQVRGVRGVKRVRVPAVAEIRELSGTKDIVLVAVKAYDMPEAVRQCLPFLRDESFVVSMQNGICTDAIAEIAGLSRTVGCVIGWGATMHAGAELELTSEGEFVIGGLESGMESRLSGLRKALDAVMPTRNRPISLESFIPSWSSIPASRRSGRSAASGSATC